MTNYPNVLCSVVMFMQSPEPGNDRILGSLPAGPVWREDNEMAEAKHLSVFRGQLSTEKGRMDAPAPGGLAKDKPSGSMREGISRAEGKHLQSRDPPPQVL